QYFILFRFRSRHVFVLQHFRAAPFVHDDRFHRRRISEWRCGDPRSSNKNDFRFHILVTSFRRQPSKRFYRACDASRFVDAPCSYPPMRKSAKRSLSFFLLQLISLARREPSRRDARRGANIAATVWSPQFDPARRQWKQ